MTRRIAKTHSATGSTLTLPSDLRFDDYSGIINAIENVPAGATAIIDFASLSNLPSWLLGLLLVMEETAHKRGVTLRVRGCNAQQRAILRMTNLARFLDDEALQQLA